MYFYFFQKGKHDFLYEERGQIPKHFYFNQKFMKKYKKRWESYPSFCSFPYCRPEAIPLTHFYTVSFIRKLIF